MITRAETNLNSMISATAEIGLFMGFPRCGNRVD